MRTTGYDKYPNRSLVKSSSRPDPPPSTRALARAHVIEGRRRRDIYKSHRLWPENVLLMAFREIQAHILTHTHTPSSHLYKKPVGLPPSFNWLVNVIVMGRFFFFFLKERYREKSVLLYSPFSLSFDGGHKASVVTFIRRLVLCVRGAIKYTSFIRRLVWIGHLKIRHVLLFIFFFCLSVCVLVCSWSWVANWIVCELYTIPKKRKKYVETRIVVVVDAGYS